MSQGSVREQGRERAQLMDWRLAGVLSAKQVRYGDMLECDATEFGSSVVVLNDAAQSSTAVPTAEGGDDAVQSTSVFESALELCRWAGLRMCDARAPRLIDVSSVLARPVQLAGVLAALTFLPSDVERARLCDAFVSEPRALLWRVHPDAADTPEQSRTRCIGDVVLSPPCPSACRCSPEATLRMIIRMRTHATFIGATERAVHPRGSDSRPHGSNTLNVALTIQTNRLKMNMTQKELAIAINETVAVIKEVENRNRLTVSHSHMHHVMQKLRKFFNLPLQMRE